MSEPPTDAERIAALEKRVKNLEVFVAKWLPALSGDIIRGMAYTIMPTPKRDDLLDAIYENYYTLNPDLRPQPTNEKLADDLSKYGKPPNE